MWRTHLGFADRKYRRLGGYGRRLACAAALKSCRDEVNLASDHAGKLLIVGSGEPSKMVVMTRDSAQAFYGAVLIAAPGDRDKALANHFVDL